MTLAPPIPPVFAPDPREGAIRDAEQAAYAHWRLSPSERYVEVDTGCGRVQVRLTEFGDDESQLPVLLLHGVSSATVLTAPLVSHLRDRKVIAVDWPGHGLSQPCIVPPGLGIRTHATTTLSSLLSVLGFAEVDLVGHSMGAQFALYAASDLPSQVRRIALLGAPGAAILGVKPITIMKLLAIPWVGRRLLSAPMSRRTFRRSQDGTLGPGALDDSPEPLVEALYLLANKSSNAASIASFFRALVRRGVVRKGVGLELDELGRLSQSTLFVWGDQDVFLAPTQAAAAIVAVRDSHLIRLPTAGHAPWLQADGAVGCAVAEHLNRVQRAGPMP